MTTAVAQRSDGALLYQEGVMGVIVLPSGIQFPPRYLQSIMAQGGWEPVTEPLVSHLPGQHDQADHAGGRGEGKSGGKNQEFRDKAKKAGLMVVDNFADVPYEGWHHLKGFILDDGSFIGAVGNDAGFPTHRQILGSIGGGMSLELFGEYEGGIAMFGFDLAGSAETFVRIEGTPSAAAAAAIAEGRRGELVWEKGYRSPGGRREYESGRIAEDASNSVTEGILRRRPKGGFDETVVAHLPGQHDQEDHGGGSGKLDPNESTVTMGLAIEGLVDREFADGFYELSPRYDETLDDLAGRIMEADNSVDFKYAQTLARVGRELAGIKDDVRFKSMTAHLPGQHDQSDHNPHGGGVAVKERARDAFERAEPWKDRELRLPAGSTRAERAAALTWHTTDYMLVQDHLRGTQTEPENLTVDPPPYEPDKPLDLELKMENGLRYYSEGTRKFVKDEFGDRVPTQREYAEAMVRNLDSLAQKANPTEADHILYREFAASQFGDPSELVGKTVVDRGYQSTSEADVSGYRYLEVGGPTAQLQILVPEGSKLITTGNETVIPREGRLRIVDYDPEGKVTTRWSGGGSYREEVVTPVLYAIYEGSSVTD